MTLSQQAVKSETTMTSNRRCLADMLIPRRTAIHAIAIFFLGALATSAWADEGLWTFDNFPAARLKAAYGVDIDKRWLDHVMGAEVRLSNGCSASLVSSTGLVLTANHCISEYVEELSGPKHDYYNDGYVAADQDDEKRAVGLSAEVLISITDVTPQIRRAESGLSGDALVKAHTETITTLERNGCADSDASRCQVVDFYQGAQYKLYKYRKYDEIRLVFSPGVSAASFGNGEFPPYHFDAAFVRLYQKGAPAQTPTHLKWDSSAPRPGELVFVAGNPRRSERALTFSQLKTEHDFSLPYELVQSAELIGRLTRFSEESTENKTASQFELFDVTNYYGYLLDLLTNTLGNESFFAKKAAEEADFRSKTGPDLQAQWAAIAKAEQRRRDLGLAYDYLVSGPSLSGGPASELFSYAHTLVWGAIERAKPSAERMPGYMDSQLPLREKSLFENPPIYIPLEQLQLEDWLSRVRDYLAPDDPAAMVLLDHESPEVIAARLSQSKLGDVNLRRQLWNGGLAAIQASNDPMIRYVLRIEPAARAMDAKWKEAVTGPEARAAGIIAQARLKIDGTNLYPDANGTLRLSYGMIEGLTQDGKSIGPFSTFGGLYQHATGYNPYKLNSRWRAAENKLNPKTVLDMSTTNDTINGNSGSPMLNARGEVIGVFGGGNTSAMGGDYAYDPKLNRAYGVTSVAITEALLNIYDAKNLVKELSLTASQSFIQKKPKLRL